MSNNNNRNNNRRRGRGNNRSQGGGNQLNRIDSRARGNAPQLLEKYRKLAHDASLNGDRVQAEYYLQFADHYFRVIADSRSQKDDQQRPRREFEHGQGDDGDYFEDEFDRGQRHESRRREEPAAEVSEEGEDSPRASEGAAVEGEEYEAGDNPFARPSRGNKPRRGNRRDREERDEQDDDRGNRLDPAALPGAIGRDDSVRDEPASEEPEAEEVREEQPSPARRALKPRRPRARKSDDEELEVVG